MRSLELTIWIGLGLGSSSAHGQTLDAVRVVSQPRDRSIVLPGEFLP